MGHRRGSASVALILVVLGILGIAVVAVSWWSLPEVLGSKTKLRPATAKVIESAPCGKSTRGDLVEVRVDGAAKRVRFDGCGHTSGQRLPVRIPVDPGKKFKVRSAESGEGTAGGSSGTRERASWVLLTLAGVAGGGYSLMLRPRGG